MTGARRLILARYVALVALAIVLAYLGVTMLEAPDNSGILILAALTAFGTLLARLPISAPAALAAGVMAFLHAALTLFTRTARDGLLFEVVYLVAAGVLVAAAAVLVRAIRGASSTSDDAPRT